MSPSATESQTNMGLDQGASACAPATQKILDLQENLTLEQSGESLKCSEGPAEPLSVTSDYDSGVDEQISPRPEEEATFSQCSSSADLRERVIADSEFPQPVGLSAFVGVQVLEDGSQRHLIFYPQPDSATQMYPPGVMFAPQMVPGATVPIEDLFQGLSLGQSAPSPPHHCAHCEPQVFTTPPPPTAPVYVQAPLPYMAPPPSDAVAESPEQTPPRGNLSPPPPPLALAAQPAQVASDSTQFAPMPQLPAPHASETVTTTGHRVGKTVLFATAPAAETSDPKDHGYDPTVSQHMEIVWHGEFQKNFAAFLQYGHRWILKPVDTPPEGRCYKFKDSAKVRFMCHCGNAWTSMKGRVFFWIHLDQKENIGGVFFKLYGQACSKCEDEESFCPAMWYPEEVIKVIGNVFNRVGQLYYGFALPHLRIDRRGGKPQHHHNTKRCQACKEGVCKFEWMFS